MRLHALDLLVHALAVKATAMINAYGASAVHYGAAAKVACCRLAERAVDEGRHLLGARAPLKARCHTSA